jgi:DNA-binding response OmpR family regulator
MKILMIEDNLSVCTMTEMFFAKEGFETEFVHDGLEGYNRFKSDDWDLLIIEIMLAVHGRGHDLQKGQGREHGSDYYADGKRYGIRPGARF